MDTMLFVVLGAVVSATVAYVLARRHHAKVAAEDRRYFFNHGVDFGRHVERTVTAETQKRQAVSAARRVPIGAPAPLAPVNDDNGLLSGLLLGAMMADKGSQVADPTPALPSFDTAFSGGESGGAGAGADFSGPSTPEAPSCDTSSVGSSSDFTSGSCDAGSSFDAGSSGGGDFGS